MNNVKYDILFDQVSSYDAAGVSILRDVSFHVPAHSVLALAGDPSCCEAVTGLLTRAIEIRSGCIRIGGRRLHTAMIQCLSGEEDYPATTIYQYIAGAGGRASVMEVLEAAEKALVLDFSWELPEGVHSNIRDVDTLQLPYVRIARALLHPAPVVLLDSRFLFPGAEDDALLLQAMASLVKEKTVVMTSPTPAVLALADAVLVLKNGGVAAFCPRQQQTCEE